MVMVLVVRATSADRGRERRESRTLGRTDSRGIG